MRVAFDTACSTAGESSTHACRVDQYIVYPPYVPCKSRRASSFVCVYVSCTRVQRSCRVAHTSTPVYTRFAVCRHMCAVSKSPVCVCVCVCVPLRALMDVPGLDARHIASKAMQIAADMCVFTNSNFMIEEVAPSGEATGLK